MQDELKHIKVEQRSDADRIETVISDLKYDIRNLEYKLEKKSQDAENLVKTVKDLNFKLNVMERSLEKSEEELELALEDVAERDREIDELNGQLQNTIEQSYIMSGRSVRSSSMASRALSKDASSSQFSLTRDDSSISIIQKTVTLSENNDGNLTLQLLPDTDPSEYEAPVDDPTELKPAELSEDEKEYDNDDIVAEATSQKRERRLFRTPQSQLRHLKRNVVVEREGGGGIEELMVNSSENVDRKLVKVRKPIKGKDMCSLLVHAFLNAEECLLNNVFGLFIVCMVMFSVVLYSGISSHSLDCPTDSGSDTDEDEEAQKARMKRTAAKRAAKKRTELREYKKKLTDQKKMDTLHAIEKTKAANEKSFATMQKKTQKTVQLQERTAMAANTPVATANISIEEAMKIVGPAGGSAVPTPTAAGKDKPEVLSVSLANYMSCHSSSYAEHTPVFMKMWLQ